jgi:3-oxoacyl-[acyl-carrier protein] reductase
MKNRTALITGASRGIGRAIALRLAASGSNVAVNYRSSDSAASEVVRQIEAMGGQAIMVQADVSDSGQVRAMAAHVLQRFGRIDILVNNAAVLHTGDLDTFESTAGLEEMRRVNVDGLVHVTRAVSAAMIEQRYGRIINITSIAAHGTTFPGNTFYAATKAAVNTLTRRFALQLGEHGITVNAVAPGYIVTDMASQDHSEDSRRDLIDRISGLTMVRRIGQPEDIAHAVEFIASEEAGFITAQVLTVDGGRTDYIAHP